MSLSVETLQVDIEQGSNTASSSLDALTRSLNTLRTAAKGGAGLTATTAQLSRLNAAINGLNGTSVANLNSLAQGLKTLSSIGNVKLSSSVASQITSIGTAAKSLQGVNFAPIASLASALQPLSSLGKTNIGSFINQLGKIPQLTAQLGTVNMGSFSSQIQNLATALAPLSQMGKSNLGSVLNQLGKLPQITAQLSGMDMGAFATQIQRVTTAIQPLATAMASVSAGFNAFPSKIQKVITGNTPLIKSNQSVGISFIALVAKLQVAIVSLKGAGRVISSWITKSNAYVENLNLFTVAMGEYATAAQKYAEKVGELIGIDPSEWMRNQGIFMTLITGFGVASDKAAVMSQNLTQLGYDLSSFFNISYEDSMQKLQSAISGELEPVRRLGYDLSQTKLQALALELGINRNVSAMTQAEKALLRYYALMTQVTTAQGDMARTLSSPANQLRILQAQATQAARALGNIFIPALNTILPYAIAFVRIIRWVAQEIANLFGFSIPSVDYSGLSSLGASADDATGSLNNATGAANDLKKAVLGIDELNVLDKSSGGGGGAGGGGGGDLDFKLPTYDFLAGLTESKANKIFESMKTRIEPFVKWVVENFKEILTVVGSIAAGLLTWKVASAITDLFSAISTGSINKVALGLTLMVTGFTLEFSGAYAIGYGDANWWDYVKTALGAALGIGGALLLFGTTPVGWAVGIGLALTVLVTGITLGMTQAAKDADLAKRFGETVLTEDEVNSWSQYLTKTELGVKVKLYVSEQENIAEAKTEVEKAIETLNSYNFKIDCGIAVTQENYQGAVDSFVSAAEEYLAQKQITAAMAVDIVYDDSATGTRLTEFVNSFYSTSYSQLTELGSQLKKVVSEGFVDGQWIGDKLAEATKLQKEIQGVLDYISTVEFNAKLTALKLDASQTDLSPESFQALLTQAQDTISEQMSNLEGVRLEALKVAKMEFDQNILNGMSQDAAQQLYDSAVSEADKAFRNGKLELSFGTFDFGIEVLQNAFKDEMDKTVPFFQQSTQDLFMQGTMCLMPEQTYDNVTNLVTQLQDAYTFGLQNLDISSAARSNIQDMVEALQPTTAQYEEVAAAARTAGESVPENVSKGLNDVNQLKSVTGDVEAINYMIGEHLSTDTSFLDLLSTSEDAGKWVNSSIAEGLLNNTQVVVDASNGTITMMNDAIGSKTYEITPTLVQNMKDLGFNLSDGLLDGAQTEMQNNSKSWKDWAIWPWNWFKETNDINSPSKLFFTGGGYIMQGMLDGMSGWDSKFKAIFKNIVNVGVDAINGFIDWMNRNLRISWGGIKIKGEEVIPGGSFQLFTIPHIPTFEQGGFPDAGQLFIAREAGAEMVGSIGNRTAVANNDQIVTAVASGVAQSNEEQNDLLRQGIALLQALLDKDGNTYLDGKKVNSSLSKVQRDSGATILTVGGTA